MAWLPLAGCPQGLLPAGPAPHAVVPTRWMPSVPRRADERSEDFALRVQEVGR